MSSIVLDSSAALAHVLGELGGTRVTAALAAQKASISMSAVNWCEVLARLQRHSSVVDANELASMLPGVEVVPFGLLEAERTAALAKSCGALSLGDRACLALAESRQATAWTMDKIWARMTIPIEVEILR